MYKLSTWCGTVRRQDGLASFKALVSLKILLSCRFSWYSVGIPTAMWLPLFMNMHPGSQLLPPEQTGAAALMYGGGT